MRCFCHVLEIPPECNFGTFGWGQGNATEIQKKYSKNARGKSIEGTRCDKLLQNSDRESAQIKKLGTNESQKHRYSTPVKPLGRLFGGFGNNYLYCRVSFKEVSPLQHQISPTTTTPGAAPLRQSLGLRPLYLAFILPCSFIITFTATAMLLAPTSG